MHPFDILPLDNGARFIFSPCPGTKGETLERALDTLRGAGANAVVTLLPESEMQQLQVEHLADAVRARSMSWLHLPIEDDSEPQQAFNDAWKKSRAELLQLIADKKTLLIHCRGGSGRTGLVAALLLLEMGQSWKQVRAQIQALRPKSLTLPAHLNFLKRAYSIEG